MTKRPNLAANVKAAAGSSAPEPVMPLARPPVEPREPPPAETGKRRPSSRAGRKAVYAWVAPAEHKKLTLLSVELDRTIDALVAEGVQLLFAKYGQG